VGTTYVARSSEPTLPESPLSWQYGPPGEVIIPSGALDARALALVPIAKWVRTDPSATVYCITTRIGCCVDHGSWLLVDPDGSVAEHGGCARYHHLARAPSWLAVAATPGLGGIC
jgi:hypothetical protein